MCRKGKSVETDSNLVAAKGWGAGWAGPERDGSINMGLVWGMMEMFGTRQRCWLCNVVNALNTTDLHVLNGYCHITGISPKFEKTHPTSG